jgi:YVTN family beta-propeller protein
VRVCRAERVRAFQARQGTGTAKGLSIEKGARMLPVRQPRAAGGADRFSRVPLKLLGVLLGGALLTVSVGTSAAAAVPPSTAYVTNSGSKSVTLIALATNKAGPEIKVGKAPQGIAITPNGRTAYVVNDGSDGSGSVTPIELATNTAGPEIKVGRAPQGIAITPDGKTAYVANQGSESVTPIELASNKAGPEIKVGKGPFGVAITPDGKTAYVTNYVSESVTPIALATNKAGGEIRVGEGPIGIAITPAGKTAYVTTHVESVTRITLATNTPGAEIKVGRRPIGIAITPNGRTAYVTNGGSESVTPIALASNKVGGEIKVGNDPGGIAITPDGRTAYVSNEGSGSVTPIALATNTPGAEIKVGIHPHGVAITPPAAPMVLTQAASAITQSTATLNALVNPNEELISECKFQYGTSTSYGSSLACMPSPGFGPGPVAVSAPITGLAANSAYHFTVSATNQGGTSTGLDVSFKTLTTPAAAAQRPAIIAARLTNKRFRVGRQATAISAKKTPLGTTFRFTLSAAAKLQITITRTAAGLRHGHSCLAPSPKLKRAHAKRCTRTLTVGTLTRARERQGADSVAFSGRIGHRALGPQPYRAVLSASNTGGRSTSVMLSFAIVH